tara:strand:- start:198 stop:1298 length:1101 start_codon:yes stop_codon:yes gene_type:complete
MARNIVKSYNSVVATSESTVAFDTADQSLLLHKITQGLEYSIGYERQQSKQIGSQDFSTNDIFRQPDVSLNITYIPEPSFANEVQGRFVDSKPNSSFKNFFNTNEQDSTNFFVLITKNAEDSFLDKIEFLTAGGQNFNGDDAIAFGNCFATSYGLSYSVGSLPSVSTQYICSNTVFDKLTGTSMQSPAINLTGGNNDNVGRTRFNFNIESSSASSEKAPPIVNQNNTNSDVTLQNLQVGGQIISGRHLVQSVDMNVSLPRVSSYGLGNDYAYNRKRQFPANGTFSVSSLVSGLESGAMTGVLASDQSYQFDLKLDASGKNMIYRIEDAKLTSYNYSMNVNGTMSYDASFSFEVTQSKGLKVSGTSY